MMWIVISYDVSTDDRAGRKRLRRVAKVCERHGQRVQKSVFECQVDDMTFEKLRHQLLKEINESEDSLRIYRIMEPREEYVEQYGITETFSFEDPLVL